jgi:protein-L-isoaspartate(D-aspartate) O-methyltransferase
MTDGGGMISNWDQALLDEVRAFHARLMAAASGSDDQRLERIFELVPREAFLGPGPWQIFVKGRYVETPSGNPIHVYQNTLVALDAARGINNGEPYLHAAWLGAVAPSSGETVIHVGAGSGYYTAILSMLVLPEGKLLAFEIDAALAARADRNLAPYEGITVVHGDATTAEMPDCDLIYVNAGVVWLPRSWLEVLRPGGRIIVPWSPSRDVGLTLLMTKMEDGFAVRPLGPSWFIPCIGASDPSGCTKVPTPSEARSIKQAWLTDERPPDDTAIAICRDVWFA